MGVLEQRQVADENWKREVDRRLDEHFEAIERHAELLAEGDTRMTALAAAIENNTKITEGVKADTAVIVEWVTALRGFFKVNKLLGMAVIAVAAFLVAAGVVYWFLTTGQLPRKVHATPPVLAQSREP